MSLSNIVLNDGESTPVAHTFAPASQQGLVTTWKEKNNNLFSGSNVLTASVTDPNGNRVADQVRVKLLLNEVVQDTNDSTYDVDYFSTIEVRAVISRDASEQHAKNLVALIENGLADTVLRAYFESRTPAI